MSIIKTLSKSKRGGVIREFLKRTFFSLAIFSLLIFTVIVFVGCGTAAKQVRDKESSAPVVVTPSPAAQIVSIEASGYKDKYFAGEEFSTENIIVIGTYDNAETADISHLALYSGYSSEPGTYTVTVNIQDQSEDIFTTFNIEVLDIVLESITIKTPPTKTTYYVGEVLVTVGLVVEGTYNNETTAPITDYELSSFDSSTAGTKTITATVAGVEPKIFTVTVQKVPYAFIFELTVSVNAGDTFILPIHDNTENDLYIDWRDGEIQHYTGKPTGRQGVSHKYETGGTPTIRLAGHTYFTGTYGITNGGALGFGFCSSTAADTYGENTNRQKLIGISGNVSALLGSFPPASNAYIGYYAFYNCTNLTGSIPAGLFGSLSGARASNMFCSTFSGCSGLTGSIPAVLFGNMSGGAADIMFAYTFNGCNGLTGPIPAGLFGPLSGAPASNMFAGTFQDCSGLTGPIPAGLFGNMSGNAERSMFSTTFSGCSNLTGFGAGFTFGSFTRTEEQIFYRTFYNCTELTGSIPVGLFGNMSAGGSCNLMFVNTFYGCSGLTGQSARTPDNTPLYTMFSGATTVHVGGCYIGATGLSDYESIPSAWKDPYPY